MCIAFNIFFILNNFKDSDHREDDGLALSVMKMAIIVFGDKYMFKFSELDNITTATCMRSINMHTWRCLLYYKQHFISDMRLIAFSD